MRAARTAPAGYAAGGTITLDGNDRLKRRLNVAATLAMAGCAVAFLTLVGALRPDLAEVGVVVRDPGDLVMVPVVSITLAALGLALVLPPLGVALALIAAVNAAGSVGDLYYLCARVGRAPRSAVVEDRVDGITWHVDAR